MSQQIARRTTALTVRITSGQSLSLPVAIQDHVLVAIQVPAAWTAAALTFQGAVGVGKGDQAGSGTTWGDVYDDAGVEVSIAQANVVPGRVLVNASILEKLAALPAIRIRSGTSGAAVAQGADRDIVLLLKG